MKDFPNIDGKFGENGDSKWPSSDLVSQYFSFRLYTKLIEGVDNKLFVYVTTCSVRMLLIRSINHFVFEMFIKYAK